MTRSVGDLLRLKTVKARVGLSKSEIYRRIKAGRFPPSIRLSPKVAVWRSQDIDAWIEGQLALATCDHSVART